MLGVSPDPTIIDKTCSKRPFSGLLGSCHTSKKRRGAARAGRPPPAGPARRRRRGRRCPCGDAPGRTRHPTLPRTKPDQTRPNQTAPGHRVASSAQRPSELGRARPCRRGARDNGAQRVEGYDVGGDGSLPRGAVRTGRGRSFSPLRPDPVGPPRVLQTDSSLGTRLLHAGEDLHRFLKGRAALCPAALPVRQGRLGTREGPRRPQLEPRKASWRIVALSEKHGRPPARQATRGRASAGAHPAARAHALMSELNVTTSGDSPPTSISSTTCTCERGGRQAAFPGCLCARARFVDGMRRRRWARAGPAPP